MLSDSDFKFAHQIIHERTFRSQITTDDEVLTYFMNIEERVHALDSRKFLKLPPKPTPVKASAVNAGESHPKGKSKGGKGRFESAPPPNTQSPLKSDRKGGKKGAGRGKGPKPMPKPNPVSSGQPVKPKASGASPTSTGGEKKPQMKQPGRIQRQCVPIYTPVRLSSGCELCFSA